MLSKLKRLIVDKSFSIAPLTTLQKRRLLIKKQLCFSDLNEELLTEFAKLTIEIKLKAGRIIVQKGDLIDSFYLIASGTAEIFLEQNRNNALFLKSGDAIGLSAEGFFSETGTRVATVIAKTSMTLLKINIEDLQVFLSTYPEAFNYNSLSKKINRMLFLKSILPFAHLSTKRLLWINQRVKEKNFSANETIFSQGDKGDICYFILSGKVEVIEKHNDTRHQIAILESAMIFGETSLLIHAERNATVRTLEPCTFLVLDRLDLLDLIRNENKVGRQLMEMQILRGRPQRNNKVMHYENKTKEGQTFYILKNKANHSYYKLSAEDWFVWQQLDGTKGFREISLNVYNKFNYFIPDALFELICSLIRLGFVNLPAAKFKYASSKRPLWFRILQFLKRMTSLQIVAADHCDDWLTKSFKRGIYIFYTKWMQILFLLIVIFGSISFVLITPYANKTINYIPYAWWLIVLNIPLIFIFVPLHELYHAYATKKFNRHVNSFGFGLIWLLPYAFTNTSDMWLSNRRERMIVNAAGIWGDMVVASLVASLLLFISNDYVMLFCWLLVTGMIVSILKNLNPVFEFDGYYLLMDLMDKSNLRQSSLEWLTKAFSPPLSKEKFLINYWVEKVYLFSCTIYLGAIFFITFFIQNNIVIKLLPYNMGHVLYLYKFILPALATILSSLTMISEIRFARMSNKIGHD